MNVFLNKKEYRKQKIQFTIFRLIFDQTIRYRILKTKTAINAFNFLNGYKEVELDKSESLDKKNGIIQPTNLFHLKPPIKQEARDERGTKKVLESFDKPISLTEVEYSLDNFHRSNQDTCLVHKPSVFEGQWVQSGDLLADCSASVGGELALGQNILIG
jgi:hypothetical protein